MYRLAAAWSVDISVGILWGKTDAGSLAGSRMSRSGLIQGKLLGNGSEEFSHVLGSLGRRLEEEKAGLSGVGLGICSWDGSLIGLFVDQIELVSSKRNDDVFICLTL
jgi:hypothetical protein